MREALKLALEALETCYAGDYSTGHVIDPSFDEDAVKEAIIAIKKALAKPKQKPVAWKLVPIEPTREMLEAMDECSIEGYDEHLYAGHAASVYMAAVDVAPSPPQQCYCGDITRLGVVHRADSFCDEKPEQEPVVFLSEWSDWRNMVVQNLMRHGNVDKDFAKRLAHYYQDMTPQRTWVGLTDEDMASMSIVGTYATLRDWFKAVEAKLKEKNT